MKELIIMSFKEINIKDLDENFVKIVADEWMLVSAGDEKKYNISLFSFFTPMLTDILMYIH